MCCNRPRPVSADLAHRLTRTFAAHPAPMPTADATRYATLPIAKATFEYAGETALTVVSPVTRKIYRFEQPGARLEVDLRDRSWLAFVPHLAAVRS